MFSLDNSNSNKENHGDSESVASGFQSNSGSIFWFSFPLVIPENTDEIMAAYNQKMQHVRSVESMQSSMQNMMASSSHMVYDSANSNTLNEKFEDVSLEKNQNKTRPCSEDNNLMPAKKKQKILSTVNMTQAECNDMCDKLSEPLQSGGNVAGEVDSNTSLEVKSPGITNSKRTRHALVIDDSITIRKSIERALVKMGFAVSLATNGMEGLKCLQKSLFDVVLCDFLMPIMDGLDCVQQYRSWENRNRPWFRQVGINFRKHVCFKC